MVRQGFTLVEILMVLALTAIITGTTLVSYTYVSGRQLDTNVRTLVADLEWARERAVSSHRNCSIRFSLSRNDYQIYNGSVSPANLIKRQRCALGVDVVNVTNSTATALTASQFNFTAHTGLPFANGVETGEGILIYLMQNFRVRRIRINNETGFIKIEQP